MLQFFYEWIDSIVKSNLLVNNVIHKWFGKAMPSLSNGHNNTISYLRLLVELEEDSSILFLCFVRHLHTCVGAVKIIIYVELFVIP